MCGDSNAMVKSEAGLDRPATGFAESIRTLRNSIMLADFDRRLKTILVTSASPAEGKSTTAGYLAFSHAQQGKKTLLIDGDLRRPSLHRRFDLPSGTGLSNVLLGELPWRDAVLPVPGAQNLEVLPAGPSSRRAADIVGSEIGQLLNEASRGYDLVIVDAPPILGFAEPLQMATAVDGVLIVTRAGETNRKALASVVSTLTRLRANVIGLALNEVRQGTHEGYYYGYYGNYNKYYARQ
jgi:capsular exopolysaccharide synthesis family protein